MVTPPIWTWHTVDMVSAEYMVGVGVATYDDDLRSPRNSDGASRFGLVSLARLLDRRVARPITV